MLAEDAAAAEDQDEYVFWVSKEARWSHLHANAKQPTIGNREVASARVGLRFKACGSHQRSKSRNAIFRG